MNNKSNVSTTYCTDCGQPMEADWKYCPHCAEKQKKAKCIYCKNEINALWDFCPFCKKPLKVKAYVGTKQAADDWAKIILRSN